MIWECEDCGWTCQPNPYLSLAEAECDNCGGELQVADNCEGQDDSDPMQRTCDDCGAEPGQECSWSCSSNWN